MENTYVSNLFEAHIDGNLIFKHYENGRAVLSFYLAPVSKEGFNSTLYSVIEGERAIELRNVLKDKMKVKVRVTSERVIYHLRYDCPNLEKNVGPIYIFGYLVNEITILEDRRSFYEARS